MNKNWQESVGYLGDNEYNSLVGVQRGLGVLFLFLFFGGKSLMGNKTF